MTDKSFVQKKLFDDPYRHHGDINRFVQKKLFGFVYCHQNRFMMTCQTRSKRETFLRYFNGDPSKISVCEGYDLISRSDDNMDRDTSKITICGGYDLICHSDGNKPGCGHIFHCSNDIKPLQYGC